MGHVRKFTVPVHFAKDFVFSVELRFLSWLSGDQFFGRFFYTGYTCLGYTVAWLSVKNHAQLNDSNEAISQMLEPAMSNVGNAYGLVTL